MKLSDILNHLFKDEVYLYLLRKSFTLGFAVYEEIKTHIGPYIESCKDFSDSNDFSTGNEEIRNTLLILLYTFARLDLVNGTSILLGHHIYNTEFLFYHLIPQLCHFKNNIQVVQTILNVENSKKNFFAEVKTLNEETFEYLSTQYPSKKDVLVLCLRLDKFVDEMLPLYYHTEGDNIYSYVNTCEQLEKMLKCIDPQTDDFNVLKTQLFNQNFTVVLMGDPRLQKKVHLDMLPQRERRFGLYPRRPIEFHDLIYENIIPTITSEEIHDFFMYRCHIYNCRMFVRRWLQEKKLKLSQDEIRDKLKDLAYENEDLGEVICCLIDLLDESVKKENFLLNLAIKSIKTNAFTVFKKIIIKMKNPAMKMKHHHPNLLIRLCMMQLITLPPDDEDIKFRVEEMMDFIGFLYSTRKIVRETPFIGSITANHIKNEEECVQALHIALIRNLIPRECFLHIIQFYTWFYLPYRENQIDVSPLHSVVERRLIFDRD
jgi:hypothetical protein